MLIDSLRKFLGVLIFIPFVIALLFALPKGVFAGTPAQTDTESSRRVFQRPSQNRTCSSPAYGSSISLTQHATEYNLFHQLLLLGSSLAHRSSPLAAH